MSRVPLLDIEPDLGDQLGPEQLRDARSRCMVAVVGLARGKRVARAVAAADGGFLVVRGMLTRRLTVGERRGSVLLGRGDVIYPTPGQPESAWRVEETALLAVLDERFHRCAAAWPRIVMALHERAVLRSHSLLLRLAIAEHPQIRRRVHLVLWHLADRWGRVTPQGIVVPVPLTHQLLAHITCLQRPTVSSALSQLCATGELSRLPGGGWVLHGDPPAGAPDATGARDERSHDRVLSAA
jgi:CRP-like cAMP-binding protein